MNVSTKEKASPGEGSDLLPMVEDPTSRQKAFVGRGARYFVMLSGGSPEDLIDRAHRHGSVRSAIIYSTPAAGGSVYGPVEIEPHAKDAR